MSDPSAPRPLTAADAREFRGRAQTLEPAVKLGRDGVSAGFLQSLDEALEKHGLVKIKFSDFKEEKKRLAPEIAEKSGSVLVTRVGNTAVYFRRPLRRD